MEMVYPMTLGTSWKEVPPRKKCHESTWSLIIVPRKREGTLFGPIITGMPVAWMLTVITGRRSFFPCLSFSFLKILISNIDNIILHFIKKEKLFKKIFRFFHLPQKVLLLILCFWLFFHVYSEMYLSCIELIQVNLLI